MTLPPTIRHNQSTFAALLISAILIGGFLGCQLSLAKKQAIAQKAAQIADTVAPVAPPPYKELLLALSALLSSGLLVDNRRKDTVIKVLKSNHAHQTNHPNP